MIRWAHAAGIYLQNTYRFLVRYVQRTRLTPPDIFNTVQINLSKIVPPPPNGLQQVSSAVRMSHSTVSNLSKMTQPLAHLLKNRPFVLDPNLRQSTYKLIQEIKTLQAQSCSSCSLEIKTLADVQKAVNTLRRHKAAMAPAEKETLAAIQSGYRSVSKQFIQNFHGYLQSMKLTTADWLQYALVLYGTYTIVGDNIGRFNDIVNFRTESSDAQELAKQIKQLNEILANMSSGSGANYLNSKDTDSPLGPLDLRPSDKTKHTTPPQPPTIIKV